MPRSRHVCPAPGCPTILAANVRRCPDHAAAYEQARGTRQQRGYDADHQHRRRRWEPDVKTGTVRCPRCHELIDPADDWDLGHTDDRKAWTGPEHAHCNRAAGGRAAHAQ